MKKHIIFFLTLGCIMQISVIYAQEEIIISNLTASSGKEYGINKLIPGEHQYMDRDYLFNYVPEEVDGCLHIKTCGNDKFVSEDDICVSFDCNCDVDVYILYADKFPVTPQWLNEFERVRLNITRKDSDPANLKGYFSLYRKSFPKGHVSLKGCSSKIMLARKGFVESLGYTYCMYTILIKKKI